MPVHQGYGATVYAPDTGGNFSTAATGEACSLVSGSTYRIVAEDRRLLDWNQPPAVYDQGTLLSPGDYRVNYQGGEFILRAAAVGALTADFNYLPPLVELGQAHAWSIEAQVAALEITDFSSSGWREKTAGLRGWKAELKRYYLNSYFFNALAVSGKALLFKFYLDAVNGFIGWGKFSLNLRAEQAGLIGESVTIQGVTELQWF